MYKQLTCNTATHTQYIPVLHDAAQLITKACETSTFLAYFQLWQMSIQGFCCLRTFQGICAQLFQTQSTKNCQGWNAAEYHLEGESNCGG